MPDAPPPPASPLLITQTISLKKGWTWISLNVWNDVMTADDVLGTLTDASNGFVKSQSRYSDFYMQANPPRWAGTLKHFDKNTMYKIFLSTIDQTITVTGWAVPIGQSHSWHMQPGWNWLPYQRQSSMSVADGMIDFSSFQAGDFLKSQAGFAQFYGASTGWHGSLRTLVPGDGYMLKVHSAGNCWFDPNKPSNGRRMSVTDEKVAMAAAPRMQPLATAPKAWSAFRASNFSDSISVTAVVVNQKDKRPLTTGWLAAFAADGSLRGVQGISAVGGKWGGLRAFFLSVFANRDGEHIKFRYAPDAHTILDLDDTKLVFHVDDVLGDLVHPYVLHPAQR